MNVSAAVKALRWNTRRARRGRTVRSSPSIPPTSAFTPTRRLNWARFTRRPSRGASGRVAAPGGSGEGGLLPRTEPAVQVVEGSEAQAFQHGSRRAGALPVPAVRHQAPTPRELPGAGLQLAQRHVHGALHVAPGELPRLADVDRRGPAGDQPGRRFG